MSAQQPPDESRLPQLRKFRMNNGRDGDTPTATDNATPDTSSADTPPTDTSAPSTSSTNSPSTDTSASDDTTVVSIDDLDVYDDLSDATVVMEPPTPRTSPVNATVGQHGTIDPAPAATPATPATPASPGSPATPAGRPPATGPIPAAVNQSMRPQPPMVPPRSAPPAGQLPPPSIVTEPAKGGRSKLIAIVAAVALVIAGAVSWFVLGGNDDDTTTNTASTDSAAAGSESLGPSDRTVDRGNAAPTGPTAEGNWAVGLCTSLTEYEATTVPIRAQVTQAVEDEASVDAMEQLREDAHQALVDLSTDVSESAAAQSTEGKAITTELAVSIDEAVETTEATTGGLAGPPMTADEIIAALDAPTTAFQAIVADLPNDQRAVLATTAQCKPFM